MRQAASMHFNWIKKNRFKLECSYHQSRTMLTGAVLNFYDLPWKCEDTEDFNTLLCSWFERNTSVSIFFQVKALSPSTSHTSQYFIGNENLWQLSWLLDRKMNPGCLYFYSRLFDQSLTVKFCSHTTEAIICDPDSKSSIVIHPHTHRFNFVNKSKRRGTHSWLQPPARAWYVPP